MIQSAWALFFDGGNWLETLDAELAAWRCLTFIISFFVKCGGCVS